MKNKTKDRIKNKKVSKMNYSIQLFMIEELSVRPAELLVLSAIYSFTKGDDGFYYGTQEYLAHITDVSVSSLKRILTGLIEKGYVERCVIDGRRGYRSSSAVVPNEEKDPLADECGYDDDKPAPPPYEMIDGEDHIGEYVHSTHRPKFEFYPIGRMGLVSVTPEQYKHLIELVEAEVIHAYARRIELMITDEGYRIHHPYKLIKKWILESTKV